MDFDQLVTFMEVAKLRSFSRAGQKVYRSQSAVSAQIRQLEQEYGERLFDRSGKTVQLTEAGTVLLDYADRMVRMRKESQLAVADHGVHPRGVLTVGANEATCLYVLPEVFAEYSQKYPDVQLSIYRNFSRKILERLEDGSIDVGIVTLPIKSATVKTRQIFHDQLRLMVPVNHPLAKLKSVPLKVAAQHAFIFPKTGFTRQLLEKVFRPHASTLNVRMELPSVGMIKGFVTAGLGVSIISSTFAADEVLSGKAKLLDIEDADLSRNLGVAYRRNVTLPRSAASFIELIQKKPLGDEVAAPKKRKE